jgi:hypothetical protein
VVQGGAYKDITLPARNAIIQLLTLVPENRGVRIGKYFSPKSQRTTLLDKDTKMLPNLQLMLPLSGQILPEANLLEQQTFQTLCFFIVNDDKLTG